MKGYLKLDNELEHKNKSSKNRFIKNTKFIFFRFKEKKEYKKI